MRNILITCSILSITFSSKVSCSNRKVVYLEASRSLFSYRDTFFSLRSSVYYLFLSLATSTTGVAFAEISLLSATIAQFR